GLRLFGNRASQARMRVAERRDADARQQVQILATVGIEQTCTLAAHQRDRLPPIGLQHMPRFKSLNVFHHNRHDLRPLLVRLEPDCYIRTAAINRVAPGGAALSAAASKAARSRPSTITTSPTP